MAGKTQTTEKLLQQIKELKRKLRKSAAAGVKQDINLLKLKDKETKAAREAIKNSENQYRLLFEENPMPLFIYDFDSLKILAVNQAAVNHYGYSHKEFLKMDALKIRPKENRKDYLNYRKSVIKKGQKYEAHNAGIWIHIKKNGELIKVEIIRRAINFGGKKAIIILANDVTAKLKSAEELEKRNKEIRLLYEAEKELSSTLESAVVYDRIYLVVSEIMTCDSMIISSFDKKEKLIKCLSVWADGNKVSTEDFPLIPLAPAGRGIQSRVIRSGKSLLITDYKSLFKTSKYKFTRTNNPLAAKKHVLYSNAIIIPLILEGEVIGTLQVLSRKKNTYNGEHLKILEAISSHISASTANALLYQQAQNEIAERSKAEEALKKRTDEISLLYDAYIELTSTLVPAVIYEKVYQILIKLLPCDAMMISSYDENTGVIKPVSVWQGNIKHDTVNFPSMPANKEGLGTQSRVILSGEPLMLNDYMNYISKLKIKFLFDENGKTLQNIPDSATQTRSALLVPMKIENKVIGVISVFSYVLNAYTINNLNLLQALSTQISAATVNAMLYQQAQNEIEHRKKSEEELRKNQSTLENAQRVSHLGSWEMKAGSDKIFFSDELCRICGIENSKEGFDLEFAMNLFHPDDRKVVLSSYNRIKDSGGQVLSEKRIKRTDGEIKFVSLHTESVRDDRNNIISFIGTVHDITELKKINRELLKSVEEKEIMLKEIHHRVKNNLQVVSSLLRMQSETISDTAIREHLKISEQRVRSMALIHQQLYKTKDLSRINFKEYINELCMYLYHAYSLGSSKIRLTVEAGEIYFGIDTALPCGLIINELITNSLKHAFPEGVNGEIKISLTKEKDNKNLLVVKDNGIGKKSIKEKETEGTLGMQLIGTLTEQLEGSLTINNDNGFETRISFQDLIYKHRI